VITTPKVWAARSARDVTIMQSATPPPAAVGREFRRTDRLLIKFGTIGPGTAAPTVTAQLLNQQGTKMLDVAVTTGDAHSIDLPLANLAAGQYLLEITAAAEGQKPVSELLAFRIGS
jgi:hypothetical protein